MTNPSTALDTLRLCYGNVSDTLGMLVRTALVPSPGNVFIDCDFSAIEARVIAWLAGEEPILEVFRSHGKIYEATAAMMFNVPIENVDKKLRQQGKVASLACIAEGQLVLTDRGEVPIEEVTLDDKVFDGEILTSHGGLVYNGVKEVITYDGLTATPDHLVWVEGKHYPVQFGIAAASGAHLAKPKTSGTTIRKRRDNKPGAKIHERMALSIRSYKVRSLWEHTMVLLLKHKVRCVQRMPAMLSAKSRPDLALQTTYGGQAAMREPPQPQIRQLRRKRYRVSFRERERGLSLCDRDSRSTTTSATGQGGQQRSLRTGEPAVCYPQKKYEQSKMYNACQLRSALLALFRKHGETKTISRDDTGADYRASFTNGSKQTELLAFNPRKARVYDIRNAGPEHRYTVSGVLVHNCGFQGGVNALTRMDFKNELTEAEKPGLVKKWREANSKIVKLWYNLQDAAIKAVLTGQPQKVGYITYRHEVSGNQSFLTGELPSGRKLFYVRPRVVEGKWGKPSLRFWGKDDKGNWSEQDTYGGHLAENCIARGTLVYTNSGLKPIEQIVKTDLIWDGEKFVVHGGLTTKPKQSIILVDGVGMTPEHKILSQEGWINASQSKEYSRRAVGVPNSYILRGVGREKVTLEDTMRLRERIPNASIGIYEEKSCFLWVPKSKTYLGKRNDARKIQSSDVLGVAFHESSLHEPERPSVAQLWRSWHISLRKMVGQLRGFLGRYVPNLCAGTGAKSHRQRWELHARELQLGNVQTQCEEQTLKQGHRNPVGQDYCRGGFGTIRHKRDDIAVSAGTWNPGKFAIHYPGFSEQVYDIKNCGNLHRFVVQSNCGPMIVHNCTQAVARDILAESITRLAQAGYAVAFSVHDEVVIDCPRDRASLEHTYEEKGVIKLKQSHPVAQIMGIPIPWAPGLPLKAEGWLGNFYTKD